MFLLVDPSSGVIVDLNTESGDTDSAVFEDLSVGKFFGTTPFKLGILANARVGEYVGSIDGRSDGSDVGK
jgi:hypothetical protein